MGRGARPHESDVKLREASMKVRQRSRRHPFDERCAGSPQSSVRWQPLPPRHATEALFHAVLTPAWL
jgi:hypothetical protein